LIVDNTKHMFYNHIKTNYEVVIVMDTPIVKFKRLTVNRVIFANKNDNRETVFIAQYFDDTGALVFQKKLSLDETMKLESTE